MRLKRKGLKLLALFLGLSLVAAACGMTMTAASATEDTDGTEAEGAAGGELVDLGTFVGDPPEHIDPALNSTLDAYQVINAVYDGLTDIDATDPTTPKIVPHVAESFESNDDATVWTFTIKDGQAFSDGEAIAARAPSRTSWERAADLAGDYSYLLTFIDGGAERLDGTADTISGVVADDDAMTLDGHPDGPVLELPGAWLASSCSSRSPRRPSRPARTGRTGIMIGNGPYVHGAARTDEEIVLVKNDTWAGDADGDTWDDRLDKITFRVIRRPRHLVQRVRGRRGRQRQHPARPRAGGAGQLRHHARRADPRLVPLRDQRPRPARSAATRTSSSARRSRWRSTARRSTRRSTTAPAPSSTGITPKGIPGFTPGPVRVLRLRRRAGPGSSSTSGRPTAATADRAAPDPVQRRCRPRGRRRDHRRQPRRRSASRPRPTPMRQRDLLQPAGRRACCVICRAGWFADYPTYDNFMFDLFALGAARRQQLRLLNPEFDALVAEAQADRRPGRAGRSCSRRPRRSCSTSRPWPIPINWYNGDYVYNPEKIANFPQTNFGLILWEQVALAG